MRTKTSKFFIMIVVVLFSMFFLSCDQEDSADTSIDIDETGSEQTETDIDDTKEVEVEETKIGITETEILIGTSAPVVNPPMAPLGLQLTHGAQAYINEINENGGIHGRKIKIIIKNDDYDPNMCVENTLNLIEEEKVFCLFNYVGTPTTAKIMPLLADNEIPLIGLFSGSEIFREPFNKYIFNIRASYDTEIETIINYFINKKDIKDIAVLYQNDAFGTSGLRVAENKLSELGMKLTAIGSYNYGEEEISAALEKVTKSNPKAILEFSAIPTVHGGIIKGAKEYDKNIFIHSLSVAFADRSYVEAFVGNTLEATENVLLTQVFPNPDDRTIPIVKKFNDLLKKYYPDDSTNYSTIEGFINAVVLVEGLKRAGKDISREKFIKALESINNYDIGGIKIDYSKNDHEGLERAYITTIEKAEFETIE